MIWHHSTPRPLPEAEREAILADIKEEAGKNAAELITADGGTARFAALDVADPEAYLHLYGKPDIRPGRKMGHVNRVKK